MINPAVSNASATRDAPRTKPGDATVFEFPRSMAYRQTPAPASAAAAYRLAHGGNCPASFHTAATKLGANNTQPARISSASETRPVYHHDERSRSATVNTI